MGWHFPIPEWAMSAEINTMFFRSFRASYNINLLIHVYAIFLRLGILMLGDCLHVLQPASHTA